ncbi:hypothetical protein [Leifsonia sp. TF02-11]|uniref:hypothetical protein n=1 Tax=Leifsonia sp. TF02-11 TaxID=2815212 RepID=UPI001AA17F61|nr:hypothetical protein [Leifsonia sp. TF02-11]MBN9629129.1 hypothetical protein [Actinomycetota bacterium]MBO1739159.1 hypothetical protein [Leifsonia sp. TF02-11]
MDMSNTGGTEYPDEAGYPDGEGTLDEGTGAFHDESEGGVEVEVEEPQGVDQLDEFDRPDARDE